MTRWASCSSSALELSHQPAPGAPLVESAAAGVCNAAVLKPSEISAHISALMAGTGARGTARPAGQSRWSRGAPRKPRQLLDERFDLIFFTGGSRVGQIVLEKAAKHLTPVVLELGGKSPCLVDRDEHPLEAAPLGGLPGAGSATPGQTCVAPDYVLVHIRGGRGLQSSSRICGRP